MGGWGVEMRFLVWTLLVKGGKKEMNVFRDIKCFAKYFCIISQLCILSTIKKVQLFGFFVLLFSFCESWNTYF